MAVRWSPGVRFQRSGAQRVMKRAVLCCCLAMMFLLVAVPLPAQQAPATSAPAASLSASNSAKPEISKEVSDKLAGTIAILKITDLVTGLRASKEHEVQGLDVTQHGEEAYYLDAQETGSGIPGKNRDA